MSEKKLPKKISELIESTKGLLLDLKYSKNTIRKFIPVWDKFLKYSKLKKTDVYSVELSENFLRDTYSIQIGIKLPRKDHKKARAIQILTNYYLNKAINLRRKHKSYKLPDSFKAETDGFMLYVMKNLISESTKKKYYITFIIL